MNLKQEFLRIWQKWLISVFLLLWMLHQSDIPGPTKALAVASSTAALPPLSSVTAAGITTGVVPHSSYNSPSFTKAVPVQSSGATQSSLSSGAATGISIGILSLVILVACVIIWKRKKVLSFLVNNNWKQPKRVSKATGETNQGMEYEVPELNPRHKKQVKNPVTVFKEQYEYLRKNPEIIGTEYKNTDSVTSGIPGKETSTGRENFDAIWSREPSTEQRYDNLCQVSSKLIPAPGKYLSATYVNGHSECKEFIAAKFPLEAEQNNFWEMVFVNEINIIIILCNLTDCDTSLMPFWPVKGIGVRFGRIKVTNESEDLERTTTMRRLVLQDESETKRCILFHFHMWPQLSVPKDKEGFTQFLRQYLLFSGEDKTSSSLSLIMCSDGARQCGTFIAICTLIKQLEGGETVNVFNVVNKLRKIRPEFVGSLSHYKLCYDAVATYSKGSK